MPLANSSFLRTIIKAVENHLNQRLPRYRRGTVVGQSSDPNKILVAPSGENGVSDGFKYPIVRPYTSATVGDAGGPGVGDDILILETTPNNPAIQGQLLTNPNDKPNRDGYPGIDKVSITQNDAKKLRAHAIVVSHIPPTDADVPATARDGMHIVSTFDNSDWIRSSDVWQRESLPVGGTTGQALAKVSGTDYDVSWQTISGGGGGGSTVAVAVGFSDINLGVFEIQFVIPWDGVDFDTGSYWDMAHPSRLTVTTAGKYVVSGQVAFYTSNFPTDKFHGKVEIWVDGNPVDAFHGEAMAWGWCEFPDSDDRVTVSVNRILDLSPSDYVELVASAENATNPFAADHFSWFSIQQIA